MSGLIEAASAIMRAAERRMEIAAGNVANATTSGYKSQRLGNSTGSDFQVAQARAAVRLDQGKLVMTGRGLDLALEGDGFFAVRDNGRIVYTRAGGFQMGADGSVQTSQGLVLQQVGGGDLVLNASTAPVIEADGTVLQDGHPVGRIAVYGVAKGTPIEALSGGLFSLPDTAVEPGSPSIRQGATEASNVSVGDEMVSIMAALRSAESGAKLAQTYDDLLGKAATAFGDAGR